jgi:hypothetical protein
VTDTLTTTTPRLAELEDWLNEHHIAWELLEEVPVAAVDRDTGLTNQARLTPLNEDAVDRYAADMEAGAIFPPIVLNHVAGDTRTLIPIGGNHRLAAAERAGRHHLAAYVLDNATPELVHLLALEDNRRHGLPLTNEERMWHAVELHQSGRTLAEAAAICGTTVQALTRQLGANKATTRAIRLDLDGVSRLSVTSRYMLNTLEDDRVFARALGLVVDGAVLASEITRLVSTLNQLETRDAIQELSRMEAASVGRTRRGGGRPPSYGTAPRRRLLSDLDGILSIRPPAVLADCDTALDRQQVSNQIKAAARHLMAIEKALRP